MGVILAVVGRQDKQGRLHWLKHYQKHWPTLTTQVRWNVINLQSFLFIC